MEFVDGALDQRLRLAGWPVHRIAGHTVVDPARWIALKQGVGYGWHDEFRPAKRLLHHPLSFAFRKIGDRDAADEMYRHLLGRHLIEPGADEGGVVKSDSVAGDPTVEDEAARFLILQRLGEQVMQLEHFYSALLHLERE